MALRSPRSWSSSSPLEPSQPAIVSRICRSRARNFTSTSRKSESSSRAVLGELLVAVALARGVEHVDLARLGPRDLGVEPVALGAQELEPPLGVGVAALDDLPEQAHEGVQARLGADEGRS